MRSRGGIPSVILERGHALLGKSLGCPGKRLPAALPFAGLVVGHSQLAGLSFAKAIPPGPIRSRMIPKKYKI